MKTFRRFLTEATTTTLYHVTLTKTLPALYAKGIMLLQTSNWVQASSGQRYGGGNIFAFTNKNDAIRWAAKWDWDLHSKMGSGKISVIEFSASPNDWKVDSADPLSQASNQGKWVKSEKSVKADSITTSFPVTSAHIKLLAR